MAGQVLVGRMTAPARAYCSAGDAWALHAHFELPSMPNRKPVKVRAIKHFGTGAAAAGACKQRALELREGVTVVVKAMYLHPRRGGLEAAPVVDLDAPLIDAANIAAIATRYGT